MRIVSRSASALLIASLLLLSSTSQAGLKIFACEPEWAALARQLVPDDVKIYSATHPGQDPHYVQAKPSLIAKLRSSDLVICTGAELEMGWMPMLLRRARNPGVLVGTPGYFEAASQVSLLEQPDRLDRADGDVHGAGNPHMQMDPRRVLKVARSFSERLQQRDPTNQAIYQQRLNQLETEWQTTIQELEERASIFKGKRAVVHHREWIYLLDWLGISRVGALEPKPGVPPTVAHMSTLAELSKPDWIIRSPRNDAKPAEWLSKRTGVAVSVLPNSIEADGDLLDMYRQVVNVLAGES
ncbi:MAG: metal ABC transporter solute-binding protein, Zn/Mn family [bacterium]